RALLRWRDPGSELVAVLAEARLRLARHREGKRLRHLVAARTQRGADGGVRLAGLFFGFGAAIIAPLTVALFAGSLATEFAPLPAVIGFVSEVVEAVAAPVSARRRRRILRRRWRLRSALAPRQDPLFGHAHADEGVFAARVQPGAFVSARALRSVRRVELAV